MTSRTLSGLKFLIPALLIAAPMTACAQQQDAELTADTSQAYAIDASHTAVTFHISHFGFSSPSGKFMNIAGDIVLDETAPENSRVNVTIPVDKINTGVPDLDKHLMSADFFNTAEFPTATFSSTAVELTGETTAKVTGDLTLHGVTQPVTLDVTLNKIDMNMFNKKTAGFSASTTIKRSDFGITTYLPGLGDEVTLDIVSEANLPDA